MALMKMSDKAETISESKEQTNLHENTEEEGGRSRNFLKLISYGELRKMWQEKQSRSQMKMEVKKQISGLQEEFEDKVKEGHEKMVKKVRDFEKAIRQNRKEKQEKDKEFQSWVKKRRDELICKLYGKMEEKDLEKLKMDLSCGRVVDKEKVVEEGEEEKLKQEYGSDVKEQLEDLTKKKLQYYADEVQLRRCMQECVKKVEEWISEQKKKLVEKVMALKNSSEKSDGEEESDLRVAESKESEETESKSEMSEQKPTTSKMADEMNSENLEASESTTKREEESTDTIEKEGSNEAVQKNEVSASVSDKGGDVVEAKKKDEEVENKDEVVKEVTEKNEGNQKIERETNETDKLAEEKKETDVEVKTEQTLERKFVKDIECKVENETDTPENIPEVSLKKVAASENVVDQKESEDDTSVKMSRSEKESRNMLDLSPKRTFLNPSQRYSHFYLPDPSTLEELKLLIPNPEEHPTLYNNLLIKIFFHTRSYESSNLSNLKKQRSWCNKLLRNCNKSQQKLTNDLRDLNKIAQSNTRTDLYKNKELQKMEEGLIEVKMKALKLQRMKDFMQQASSTMLQVYNTDLQKLEDAYKTIKLVGVKSIKRYNKKKFLKAFVGLVRSNEEFPKEIEKIEHVNVTLQQAVSFITDSYFIKKSIENFT